MVPITPPCQSLVTILSSFLYVLSAMYVTRGRSSAWNSILITDAWTNLIIITAMVSCISMFIYDMYASAFLQNIGLEDVVKERTRKLEEQTGAAQEASKSKGEFLAHMSHEIRTPLNAIIGMTQIAKRANEPEKISASLDEITRASSHLLDILNDVLDMSKIESGKFSLVYEPFTLRAAMEEVSRIVELRCHEKHIRLLTNYGALPNASVSGDRLRLKQILINLLGNAVKFTSDGGEIRFLTDVTKDDGVKAEVAFSVADDGIGMTPSQVSKLFLAFEQANASVAIRFGGTGLGLAISQNLVQKMGGQITVQSELGKGSTFAFTLTFDRECANQPEDEEAFSVPDLSGKRILLAEDVELNRMILRELLEETHVELDEAEDGQGSLERFSASPVGHYGMILMDVQMPVLDGYEATKKIRALPRPDAATIPIFAMTANAYREDIEKALAAGMNGHLSKPIDLAAVMRSLTETLIK